VQACVAQFIAQGPHAVAGLAHEAEGLPEQPVEITGGTFGVGKTFVARKKHGLARRGHDQQRLFETRIVTRGPCDVGGVFAVPVNHQGIQPCLGHALAQSAYAGVEDRAAECRFGDGFAERDRAVPWSFHVSLARPRP